MEFQNKLPKKNHNVSEESDSSLFFRYISFFLLIAFCIYISFFLFSFFVTKFVSIEDEAHFFSEDIPFDADIELSESLRELYPNFPYTLWVTDMGDVQNAFATLGGNIFITKGLLESDITKNEIDFILGHEIAHIENRDVIRTLISSLPTYLFVSLLGNSAGMTLFDTIIGNPHGKTQETRADMYGLEYTMQKNGNIGCVVSFFESDNSLGDNIMTLFSGHPMTHSRMERMKTEIVEKGYPDGECNSLEY